MRLVFSIWISFCISLPLEAQEEATLNGFVKNERTGETLIGATVRAEANGAVTNKSGYFSLRSVPIGSQEIITTYLGYKKNVQRIMVVPGQNKITIGLQEEDVRGEEVTVTSERDAVRDQQISRVNIRSERIGEIPAVFAEADLFRALMFLPGVQTLSEISSGLYVRGGSPDQNLILLDGTVLYNPSHFFGFFSTFNNDAIKDVDFIKGGFPAEYGGRLSSVLSVTNKDGNRNAITGKASVSSISSRLTVEGPIDSQTTFLLSGRRSYLDVLTSLFKIEGIPQYYFYDANAKVMRILNDDMNLSVSGYSGSDNVGFDQDGLAFTLGWGNREGSTRFVYVINEKLFSTTTFSASNYYSRVEGKSLGFSFTVNNSITDYTFHTDFEWSRNERHLVKTGLWGTKYRFNYYSQNGNSAPLTDFTVFPLSLSLYVQDEWKTSEVITLQLGLRSDWMDLAKRAPTYDPRFSLRYLITEEHSLKFSAGIYHQYLKLASQPNISFFDVWTPTDETTPPSTATQFIIGYTNVPTPEYEFSVETYYKDMRDVVELRQGVFAAKTVGEAFFVGNGRSYGIEFFAQKKIGDLTGWIGYTLAWTKRKFPDINKGEEFAPKYDRRHDVSAIANYKLSDVWKIGATFTYGTGQSYTDATARYTIGPPDFNNDLVLRGAYGGLRLPSYHRMDVSVVYSFKFFGTYDANANFNVFNVYSHRNVWFRMFDTRKNPTEVTDVLLLPILPSIGMEVKF